MTPHGVQQLLTAEDYTGTAHQEFEQPKFGSGEQNFLTAQTHLATGAVELEIADLQQLRGGRLPAEVNLDTGD
jgi:hypothetical protein